MVFVPSMIPFQRPLIKRGQDTWQHTMSMDIGMGLGKGERWAPPWAWPWAEGGLTGLTGQG